MASRRDDRVDVEYRDPGGVRSRRRRQHRVDHRMAGGGTGGSGGSIGEWGRLYEGHREEQHTRTARGEDASKPIDLLLDVRVEAVLSQVDDAPVPVPVELVAIA